MRITKAVPVRIQRGRKLVEAVRALQSLDETDQFQTDLDQAVGEWQLVEAVDPRGAYHLVREYGNNLYILLAYALERIQVPTTLREQATLSMELWRATLTPEETRALQGELCLACG